MQWKEEESLEKPTGVEALFAIVAAFA